MKYKKIHCVIFLIAVLSCRQLVFAANKTFTGPGNFGTATNWNGNSLPGIGDNLQINGTCTVDNNILTNNMAYGTLTMNAGSTLNWASSGTNILSVTNVSASAATGTINMTNGGTLKINGTWTSTNLAFTPGAGTVTMGGSSVTLPAAFTSFNNLTITGSVTLSTAITVTGNFVNNGTLTAGANTITFSGSGNTTITGSSTTAFTGGITINKGSSSSVLDVQSLITLTPTSASNQLTLTQGVFKLSSASTIIPFWTFNCGSAPWNMASTATLWCNNAGATVNANSASGGSGSWCMQGTLRVTAGTVNVGTAASDFLAPQTGASIIIDGGNLVVTGRFSQGGAAWTFNMSAGTLTAATMGSTAAGRAAFFMDNTSCSFTMTGGTIIVQQPCGSAGENLGFYNLATGGSGFTGGTLQIGNASTPAASTIGITSTNPIYNLTINSANATAQLQTSALTVTNDVTITAGTLNPNALNLSVGHNWTNNATYTTSTSTVTFNGTANQTIGGSNSTTFYKLTLNNSGTSGNNVITLSKPITVSNTLTLTDGILATSATNLLTLTNSSSSATTGGNSTGPSFVDGPMRWNGLNGAGPFIFPTGAGTSTWARVAVSGVTAATDFTAQYFNSSYANVSSSDISANVLLTLATVSKVEYWDVARTSGTGNAAVTLYWENALNSHITSCLTNGFLKVGHFNTGTSKWENANSSGTVAVTGSCIGTSAGTVKSDVMTSFSPFSFGSGSSGVNPLPIELLSFNAIFNGKTIDLKWATASEINNNYFTIERSTNGVDFTIVGIVASKALNGHSTSILDYTLNDPNTETGTYYYHLKQTDFDYKYVYSDVVVASITESIDFTFDMIPNPNDGNQMAVHITTPKSGTAVFKIYDLSGKLLFTENTLVAEGDNNSLLVRFKETLNSGTYIVTVAMDDNLSKKKRMVVIRG